MPLGPLVFNPDEARLDTLLFERITTGDPDALAELYDRHSRLLFGLIVRIVNDYAEAEEVLQDVFLQAWTRAASYDATLGSPAGWLLTIARHRAIDRLRVRARQGPVAGRTNPPVTPDTPELLATQTERGACVRRALQGLPVQQRELIERAYFLGTTHSQLAAELHLPLGTVKTRIRNGLQALRHLVHDTGLLE
jgi:RNA polymerase sigma-70 factor (ECF subfamily)